MSGSMNNINRSAMFTYMRNNYNKRPARWGDFDDYGGDCTNFVSQILYAGTGGVMDSSGDLKWFYKSYSDRSSSWTSVNALYNYLTRNKGRGPQGILASGTILNYSMKPGDIIQIDFQSDGTYDHSVAINSFTKGNIEATKVCAHYDNVYNKAITDYAGKKKRWIHLYGFEY